MVNVRVALHVSWANRLQFEKIKRGGGPCRYECLRKRIGQNVRQRTEKVLHLVRYSSLFWTEKTIIKPQLELVLTNDARNTVIHVDLLLKVIRKPAGDKFKSKRVEVAKKNETGILRRSKRWKQS